ncbi:MAG: Universal stress protein [Candidatus Bathyarchaeota archaeon BA1]|nr:MAG: Universal stress protein [Candidatus Bathyarchaeota archaeon BA1]
MRMISVAEENPENFGPVDGSEYSDRALQHAIDTATKYSSEICLIHVVSTIRDLITGPETHTYIDVSRELEESGRRILSSTHQLVEKAGLKVTTKLEHGQPADRIVRIAKDKGFDLIVIGSRGLSAIKGFLLGSVSDKVTHHATCPVLVVK